MNYIPDHLKQIENLLSNLSLKTPITPKEFIQYTKSFGNKHRFYSPCFNKDGQQYFFYALLKKDAESKKQFSKELRLANFLKNYKNGFSHNFPDYVNYSIGNAHPWLLSSFIPFKTLENPIKIERLSQNLSDEDILMIGKSLFEINYNFLNYAIGFLEITINDLSLKTDSTIAKLNRFVQEGIVDRKLIVRIKDYLQTNSSLVHNQTKYFCHGDFHLGNIILMKNKNEPPKIKIIDWEKYCLSNLAYDISFLFCKTYFESNFRRKILDNYLKLIPVKELTNFKKLFRYNVIYFSVKFGLELKPYGLDRKEAETRRKWFIGLLQNSTVSFEKLITN